VVEVEAVQGGGLRLLVSSVEMGQGAATVLCQLAAESFGCAVENVELATPDTACVPDSGPTVASRTTMVVGALVQRAAGELRAALDRGGGALPESGGPLKARARYQPPQGLPWDDANFSGDAYAAYSWAVDVAEVCVDIDTGETRVEQVTAVVEAGRIVNQQLARGQIEGGILQGAGFALGEETLYERGRVANAQMTNTLIPSAMDAPSMCVDFVEPVAGAAPKGLGELPVDGAAPAIAGALSHATGKFFSKLPLTPESVLEAVNG
jgi:CO/xanthine dehydrogenase Mo-binding subunit